MNTRGAGEVVVRDLLWQNIALEPAAVRVVDTPQFQRLRYVRQLGHAFLVYPGASHSRFEHALGAYHLSRRAVDLLERRGALAGLEEPGRLAVRLAALLHDVGHYPFSHALEESGLTSHETIAERLLGGGELAAALGEAGFDNPARDIGDLIKGGGGHELGGLITGSVDLDKIDYLKRDAVMCGVPYGEVDVDRLLSCLTIVEVDGRRRIGIVEKGIAALESVLFAKYQMYRNVYWHHAVRSATAMFKRLVHEALTDRVLDPSELVEATDDSLMQRLLESDRTGLAQALRERRLYKRALELVPSELNGPPSPFPGPLPSWLRGDAARLSQAEDRLARAVGLGPAELLLDLPYKEAMLGLDLPIVRRDGVVERLTQQGWPGRMDLPPIAEQLSDSACRFRVFTRRPVEVPAEEVAEVLGQQ